MVANADLVLAFFPVGEEMTGGTGHVVEAALAREVPCQAYAVDEKGRIERIGEID